MANYEHLEILRRGIKAWNKWREKNPDIQPDLSMANLSRRRLAKLNIDRRGIGINEWIDFNNVDLQGANLSETTLVLANLSRANLAKANLTRADLGHANLRNANLSEAILFKTVLSWANLSNANLRKARLTSAVFNETVLAGVDFSLAHMARTVFGNDDLSDVEGLVSVTHAGPSVIDIATLYNSAGKIPEAFLRGCGVPDDFIAFIPSHFGIQQAIQFYSCFISYSTRDEEFARRLYSRMRDEKLRVWFAPEEMKGGQKIYDQIERAIQLHDRLLLVLSESSMQSEWVITEIQRAREAEMKENRRKLFPIAIVGFDKVKAWKRFDADLGKDLAREVREYFIPDFSNWKDHDAFEGAFARLLRNLRAEETR
ncbi:MAG TPA: toll/interleukin-1 receptor domain-containing protein [Pyrinomonadaceae bacterium]|jgi:uncharacterized protein YjbI with pentapeptide repeats